MPAAPLFAPEEYTARHETLHDLLELHGLSAVVLTSARAVAYHAGVLPAATPAALVVMAQGGTVLLPESGDGQVAAGLTVQRWDDRGRDGIFRAIAKVVGTGAAVGLEADSLTMVQAETVNTQLRLSRGVDVSPALRAQRLVKSAAEIALIRALARAADAALTTLQGAAGDDHSRARAGRAALEEQLNAALPGADLRGSGVMAPDVAGTFLCRAAAGGYAVTLRRPLGAPAAVPGALPAAALPLLAAGETCGAVAARLAGLAGGTAIRGRAAGLLVGGTVPETGLDLAADNGTVLEPGMTLSLAWRAVPPDVGPATHSICLVVGADGALPLDLPVDAG